MSARPQRSSNDGAIKRPEGRSASPSLTELERSPERLQLGPAEHSPQRIQPSRESLLGR